MIQHRAHIADFGAVAGPCGGANTAANDAAIAAAIASATKLIEFDAAVYEIGQTIVLNQHAKALVGIDGCDGFGAASEGTRFDWYGGTAPMMDIGPAWTDDLIAAQVKGFRFNGRELANKGVRVRGTRRLKLDGLATVGLAAGGIGFYFGDVPAGHLGVGENMLGDFANLSAKAEGAGTGIMFDQASQCLIRNPCVVHENGVAIYLRNCDTLTVVNASTARILGGTGHSLLFDGLASYVMGHRFFGLHCGAHPAGDLVSIYSRGEFARQNRIYGLDGVDNQPTITIEPASELYYDYQGGGYVPTLAAEMALDRMPNKLVMTY